MYGAKRRRLLQDFGIRRAEEPDGLVHAHVAAGLRDPHALPNGARLVLDEGQDGFDQDGIEAIGLEGQGEDIALSRLDALRQALLASPQARPGEHLLGDIERHHARPGPAGDDARTDADTGADVQYFAGVGDRGTGAGARASPTGPRCVW